MATYAEAQIFASLLGRGFFESVECSNPCVRMIIKDDEKEKVADYPVVFHPRRVYDASGVCSILNRMYHEGRKGHTKRTFGVGHHDLVLNEEGRESESLIRLISSVEAKRLGALLNEMYKYWIPNDPA